jgi:AraC-like DNA-binding protein
VFGQQTKPCDVCLAPEFLMFRVHFQPGALFRLLKVPLQELGEDYFDAEPVLGRGVLDVSERLASARSCAEMVETVEAYLLRSVVQATKDLIPLDRAAARLTNQPHIPLDWIARHACLSPRQFNRKFTERIGVGPKLYSRLARYHRAYLFKRAHPAVAWPTVAIEFGYTDYQHLVRDFREFTHATPTAWLREDAASPENILAQNVRFLPRKPGTR